MTWYQDSITALPAGFAQSPTIDNIMADGVSAYVSDYYEIADTKVLEIGVGSIFEIG